MIKNLLILFIQDNYSSLLLPSSLLSKQKPKERERIGTAPQQGNQKRCFFALLLLPSLSLRSKKQPLLLSYLILSYLNRKGKEGRKSCAAAQKEALLCFPCSALLPAPQEERKGKEQKKGKE
uniref:intronic ORF B at intron 1 of nad5 n=1 Tax=Moniliophthora perniciosa TaxID=153609 RepID=UPI000024234D|nr:intronic ORF B at intron 1 of nad5 [Moniliophthora perniciosa]AAQ74272.1 intronic ORF B at intron 1 of nad5 [Moniliophthora perniciosa]